MRAKVAAAGLFALFSGAALAQGPVYVAPDNGGTTVVVPNGSPASVGATVAPGYTNCDALAGSERERCLSTATPAYPAGYVTLQPGASGPGTVDKTHPGLERGIGPSSRDAGTSSAGSS